MKNFNLGHAIFLAVAINFCIFGGGFLMIATAIFNLNIGFAVLGILSIISSFFIIDSI